MTWAPRRPDCVAFWAIFFATAVATAEESAPRLAIRSPAATPDLVTVEVTGLPEESVNTLRRQASESGELPRDLASALLCMTVLQDSAGDPSGLPCALGNWRTQGTVFSFRPRFPPAPGLTLVARFDGPAFDRAAATRGPTPTLEHRLTLPALDRRSRTEVAALYPSGELLPANLLRFYLHFSEPMSAQQVLPHIRLVNVADEGVIDTAFVPIEGGLWDAERIRLTLLVHPGRVKRGVGPNQALGPVLSPGGRYRLEVAAAARDANGLPLAQSFQREFRIGPSDRTSPDPTAWRLLAPARPEDALVVLLPEPADHALLERMPIVLGPAGEALAGSATADDDERRWTFRPAEPWRPGEYRLVIPAELEDPSGNRLNRRFEDAPAAENENDEPVSLAFSVP
ncbi:MAG: hypothetical protein AAF481_08060 [Acidobacteriota bacterium]